MSDNKQETQDHSQAFKDAIDLDVPQIYFNGFTNAMGIGDLISVVQRNGKPVAIINMSYTIAKTYAEALNSMIADMEAKANQEIMTTHDVVNKVFTKDKSQ
ncbi:MAG: hypothetical protein N0E59_08890 [Candidatus Thiodiazotropha taylori]|nr:hypothetical protein [Candidatus Thiodiazotropha taylori]MCG8096102.1 hypothetical protein [Candidatus Thiodiazotropha endolucinida]MCG8106636.1 hypothetical protein [Candidatus Thiodiazotropha taylori]MCG8110866.1 hypothetical protein [Candidatus Thiodiazotropha taylori]MCW4278973.1 hypothetical protein [Candidatus Thiodiazotropha taylori]